MDGFGMWLEKRTETRRADEALWQKIKDAMIAGDKGGRPGENSARKMQMAVLEYKRQGGKYVGSKSDDGLAAWTKQKWKTVSGKNSVQGDGAGNQAYLPEKAWDALSAQEKGALTRAKRAAAASGKQHADMPTGIMRKVRRFMNTGGE